MARTSCLRPGAAFA
uniref:Uncharacterized protein n=1 Tax=Arundo donax TaxID=35708 RepID=A0A0A8YEH3_ARUDO